MASPVYQSFDTDADGTVTPTELDAGLAALHATHDADGNGTLTPKEIVAALQKVQKEAFDQKKREDEAGKAAASAGATAETCMRTAMRLAWAADKMYFPHKIKK
jgi:hypothetical protein